MVVNGYIYRDPLWKYQVKKHLYSTVNVLDEDLRRARDINVFYPARCCLTDQYYLLWRGRGRRAIFSSNLDQRGGRRECLLPASLIHSYCEASNGTNLIWPVMSMSSRGKNESFVVKLKWTLRTRNAVQYKEFKILSPSPWIVKSNKKYNSRKIKSSSNKWLYSGWMENQPERWWGFLLNRNEKLTRKQTIFQISNISTAGMRWHCRGVVRGGEPWVMFGMFGMLPSAVLALPGRSAMVREERRTQEPEMRRDPVSQSVSQWVWGSEDIQEQTLTLWHPAWSFVVRTILHYH